MIQQEPLGWGQISGFTLSYQQMGVGVAVADDQDKDMKLFLKQKSQLDFSGKLLQRVR